MRIDGKYTTAELLGIPQADFVRLANSRGTPLAWFQYLEEHVNQKATETMQKNTVSNLYAKPEEYNLYEARRKACNFYQNRIKEMQ